MLCICVATNPPRQAVTGSFPPDWPLGVQKIVLYGNVGGVRLRGWGCVGEEEVFRGLISGYVLSQSGFVQMEDMTLLIQVSFCAGGCPGAVPASPLVGGRRRGGRKAGEGYCCCQ